MLSRTKNGVRPMTARPTGMLMKKIQDQLIELVSSAAEQHAGGAAASGHGAPDAERDVALAALGEGRGQDREGGGGEEAAAEPLQGAEDDQRALGPGEAGEQRADGEEDEAGDEEAPAAEQVGHPPAEQEDAAEHDRVGGDHPLEALLAEVEVGLDRRQRHVHDRDVEDDHELRRDDDGECDPAVSARFGQ